MKTIMKYKDTAITLLVVSVPVALVWWCCGVKTFLWGVKYWNDAEKACDSMNLNNCGDTTDMAMPFIATIIGWFIMTGFLWLFLDKPEVN